jgi:hypothetical protein
MREPVGFIDRPTIDGRVITRLRIPEPPIVRVYRYGEPGHDAPMVAIGDATITIERDVVYAEIELFPSTERPEGAVPTMSLSPMDDLATSEGGTIAMTGKVGYVVFETHPAWPELLAERAGREGDTQPLPTPSTERDVVDFVKDDLDTRRELGIRRYGQALRAHNGRDALQDAYEELLDLVCYIRQLLEEKKDGSPTR